MNRNNFNKIAPFYDTLTYIIFRNIIRKSQFHFINHIPHNASVLIVGGGTGWYLYELLKRNKCKTIFYVEASSEMINLSKNKISLLSYNTEVLFIENCIEDFLITRKFDVIITNYVLDVFKEKKLKFIMNKLYTSLKEEGLWLFSDFRVNHSSSFHKYWQTALIRIMYTFFKITSGLENNKLLPFDKYLKELSAIKLYSKNFFSGMIESSIYKKNTF